MNLSKIQHPYWRHILGMFKHTFIIIKHFSLIQHEKPFLPKEFIVGTFFFNNSRILPLFILILTYNNFIFLFLFNSFIHNEKLRLFYIWWRFINNQSLFGLWNLNSNLIILKMHFLFFITILLWWLMTLEF